MTKRSCLNINSHIDPRFGGIVSSLSNFCAAVEGDGRFLSPRAAFCGPDEAGGQEKISRWPHSHRAWLWESSLRQRLDGDVSTSDLVHIHGIWEAHCQISAASARRCRRPYVISPHGMLDPWALRQKRYKKMLYARLFEMRNLAEAACLRAVTEAEARQMRALGLRNPIAVVPNGIEPPPRTSADLFYSRYPAIRDHAMVLYLGRLHPKKGVLPLAEAWRTVQDTVPRAHLVFAGPDDAGTMAAIQRILHSHSAASSVTFTGLMDHAMKWSAYAAASLFILPSYSEGFSMAVLEALSAATPVVISDGCYFDAAIRAGAGWRTGTEPVRDRKSVV